MPEIKTTGGSMAAFAVLQLLITTSNYGGVIIALDMLPTE
jgi:hypothetical protein